LEINERRNKALESQKGFLKTVAEKNDFVINDDNNTLSIIYDPTIRIIEPKFNVDNDDLLLINLPIP
jgi:hypothetical protein